MGIDLAAYLRAGDDLVAGNPVYIGEIGKPGVFSYAPPWAVLFGALSWVPDMVMQVGMVTLEPAGHPLRGRLMALVRSRLLVPGQRRW